MHYHREYGILPRQFGRPLATDYYTANHRVTFDRISEITGLSTELISTFNPQFRRGIIPGNTTPYPVRLPLSAILKLDSAGSEVHSPELRVNFDGPASVATTRSTVRAKAQQEEQEEATEEEDAKPSSRRGKRTTERQTTSTHAVTSGETLYSLAHKYGTTVEELRKNNNLRSDKLSVGQKIKITKATKSSGSSSRSSKATRRGKKRRR